MTPRGDAPALAEALARQAPALAAELLPGGRRNGQEWRAGSLAGEPGQSLGVHLYGPKAAIWSDFATGERGDALDLVAAVLFRGELPPAMAWARAWLGFKGGTVPLPQRRPQPVPQDAGAYDAARLAPARTLWVGSVSPLGTPAVPYLRDRYLGHLAAAPVVRWCAATGHPNAGGRHPAMLALVQDVHGVPTGVHRTYLTPEGAPARHLVPRKACLGPTGGGAVRLQQAGPELVVAEGIESAASASLMLDCPAWAALSTSGLVRLLLPEDVRSVIIAADHDQPGLCAADSAARRWVDEGRRVRIVHPDTPGQDFADLWAAEQEARA